MGDLPDWTQAVQGVALEATSFRSGLDADKPAVPAVGEIWLARDTKKLYVCHTAVTWSGFDASILIQGVLTLYAALVAGGYKLTGLGDPTAAQDAATKTYVDVADAAEATARIADVDAEATARIAADALRLLLAGGTMSGAIAMGTNKITGLDAPTANADAARKLDVDTVSALLDDVTQAQPARVIGTNYQNTPGKIRIVSVSLDMDAGNASNAYASALVGATSPPATTVIGVGTQTNLGNTERHAMTFIVLPNYYYKVKKTVSGTATVTLGDWTEWDLH